MAYRADAAQALYQDRYLLVVPSLDETFEAPELNDMHSDFLDIVVIICKQGYLAVTFNPRDGLYYIAVKFVSVFCGLKVVTHCGSLRVNML
jgi:hypothetical protein